MGCFDNEKNVESCIKMVEGEDGAALVEVLARHLDRESTVLELGMGRVQTWVSWRIISRSRGPTTRLFLSIDTSTVIQALTYCYSTP